jgi:hypothetical protein
VKTSRTALHLAGYRLVAATATLLAAFAGASCSSRPGTAPVPTKAEAIAQAREFFDMQREAIVANPANAPQTLALVIEFLEPMAAHYGPPFVAFLAAAKETRASWGDRPTAAAVKDGVASLAEKAAALAP